MNYAKLEGLYLYPLNRRAWPATEKQISGFPATAYAVSMQDIDLSDGSPVSNGDAAQ